MPAAVDDFANTNSDAAGPSATTNSSAAAPEVPSASQSGAAGAPPPDSTDAQAPAGAPGQRDDAGAVTEGKSDAGTPEALQKYFSAGEVCPPGAAVPCRCRCSHGFAETNVQLNDMYPCISASMPLTALTLFRASRF